MNPQKKVEFMSTTPTRHRFLCLKVQSHKLIAGCRKISMASPILVGRMTQKFVQIWGPVLVKRSVGETQRFVWNLRSNFRYFQAERLWPLSIEVVGPFLVQFGEGCQRFHLSFSWEKVAIFRLAKHRDLCERSIGVGFFAFWFIFEGKSSHFFGREKHSGLCIIEVYFSPFLELKIVAFASKGWGTINGSKLRRMSKIFDNFGIIGIMPMTNPFFFPLVLRDYNRTTDVSVVRLFRFKIIQSSPRWHVNESAFFDSGILTTGFLGRDTDQGSDFPLVD